MSGSRPEVACRRAPKKECSESCPGRIIEGIRKALSEYPSDTNAAERFAMRERIRKSLGLPDLCTREEEK